MRFTERRSSVTLAMEMTFSRGKRVVEEAGANHTTNLTIRLFVYENSDAKDL